MTSTELEQLDAAVKTYEWPDNYAKSVLGIDLHPKQAAVLRDLFKPRSRLSLRCANEVGKTARIAVTAILYALDVLDAQVISTAGVWMQVSAQLIPALKAKQHLFPKWSFNDSEIKIRGHPMYVGFSTRDEGFAQGFHRDTGRPLMAIIDEASAVPDVIYNGVEDRCNPDHLLIMGSPLDPSGRFYDIETKLARFYTHHHISQTDCLKKDGWWIDERDIERKIAKYGGKEHPFIQSNVYGNFAAKIENGLLSLLEWEQCIGNPPEWGRLDDRHLFIDVGVNNLAALRHGNKVKILRRWAVTGANEIDQICAVIVRLGLELGRDIGLKQGEITIDGGGDYGKNVGDSLQRMGWQVNRFAGQGKADDADYYNRVSEAWIGGCQIIKNCDVILPNDDNLRAQLLSRKQRAAGTGKLQVEPKDEYMKRGFDSPHEADAVMGCLLPVRHQQRVNLSGDDRLTKQAEQPMSWREQAAVESGRFTDIVLPAETML